ncbi:MAG: dinucleotide-utilizing protein [Flavobacteriaceae bacterium]|nr:dinucleotide-utilizing protein [Flavobacteriaceae bacterium]
MDRYSRHIILSEIGQEGQNKITQAKVLVVGAGGLGCPVLQYLAAAGVGTLGIIDFDVVEESNLQRQILFGTSSLGKNKAIAAKQRLEDLNPTIKIKAYPETLTSENAIKLFGDYEIIVDGTDNFDTRYLINDAAVLTNKPVVYGAIYKFEGQVAVFNYQDSATYRCLFPNKPKANSIANCSEIGVLGVLPGIIGTMQANEVLKIIIEFKDVLAGKLFCFNAKTNQTATLNINKTKYKIEALVDSNPSNCKKRMKNISLEYALNLENVVFLDVREFHEQPKINIKNYLQIPLSQFSENMSKIDKNKNTVIMCQHGIRSLKVVEFLKQQNFNNCFNLEGGIVNYNFKIEETDDK